MREVRLALSDEAHEELKRIAFESKCNMSEAVERLLLKDKNKVKR